MISVEEWNARIDAFIKDENENRGKRVPVYRIYCQDDTDRSGGGIYNETVTVDTIGRFARALGDSNPLFSDPDYRRAAIGSNTSYSPGTGALPGAFQAPPLLECCICSTFIGGKMPRLRGVSVFDAGTKWERFLPIRPGDTFSAQTENLGVREITRPEPPGSSGSFNPPGSSGSFSPPGSSDSFSSFSSAGRLLLREHRIDLTNQRGELVSSLTARSAIKCAPPVNAEESTRQHEAGKKKELHKRCSHYTEEDRRGAMHLNQQGGRPHYREEELERVYANLDAQLAGDFRRGSEPRFWEDVKIGDQLPEQIVGPYDESDAQALMSAIGAANAFATKWAAIRSRKGQGITDPETGAFRHPIDRHNSDTIARAQGLPRAIVSGIHSQALLGKAVSDWMGDAGFLRTLDCRCRKPFYFGDLSFQRGTVTGKFEKDGKHYVNLDMEAVRQDGIPHTTARAVVELPARAVAELPARGT